MRLNLETGLKYCPKCKEDKSPEAFIEDQKRIDGLACWCKKCNAASGLAWREANRERVAENFVKYWSAHPERLLLRNAKQRAKLKSVPFAIRESDILIPSNCPLCECRLETGEGKVQATSPSLDRQDPPLGYVPGNVWVICWGCNRTKQDMSGDDHIAFGFRVKDAFKEYCERMA